MEKLKVLVADDSVLSRKAVVDAVDSTGTGTVEHTAPNGSIALEWLQQCQIDVVLLSAFISGQNSLEILNKIKEKSPDSEVIILSDGDARCAEVTINALAHGAFDFIVKAAEPDPAKTTEKIKNQLGVLFTQIKVKKYSIPGKFLPDNNSKKGTETGSGAIQPVTSKSGARGTLSGIPDLVLIASSTGGPAALELMLKQLPASFPSPILVVQHMPPEFTGIFSQTLDKKCALSVREAKEGDVVQPGQVIIAPGGMHMTVCKKDNLKEIRLERTPYVNGVRPSADVLFSSAAKAYTDGNLLAVVLTGMGNDGMRGVEELKQHCKCHCITQSEQTCVVYGMPRSVYEAGLSNEVADIGKIGSRVCQIAAIEG